jgi:methylated-DNA-[protein]-cysteine S-methyltransferase
LDRKLVTLLLDRLPTPIGVALLVTDDAGRLRALEWADHEERMRLPRNARLDEASAPEAVRRPLEAYFSGDLCAIDAIDCAPGGTPFQRAVWEALRTIPPGRTMSYGALAAELGAPAAARAVGHANGANPVSVVIPCHRLVGAGGALTGYGGGLDRKRWLLAHEGALAG